MSAKEYIEVKREDFPKYGEYAQAAHCMIYCRLPGLTFEDYPLKAAVLVSTTEHGMYQYYYRFLFLFQIYVGICLSLYLILVS